MQFDPVPLYNISQILPHIKDKPEFIVIDKGWYKVVDYVYMNDKSFEGHPVLKECRGLKFCAKTGNLLARPYHKFHNLDERPEYRTANVDLTKGHVILDKLDGSMVHTCPSSMGLYLMTRKGDTEVAKKADAFLMKNQVRYGRLFDALGWTDYTYIFEYVAPHNKIVVHYEQEDLILTAIRHNQNGTYIFHDELVKIGLAFGIPVVEAFPFEGLKDDAETLSKNIKGQKDCEGYVIRFDTGAMIKIKAEEYVRKHRSKDLCSSFRGIAQLIADNTLDDVLPQLDDAWRKKVEAYAQKVNTGIDLAAYYMGENVKLKEDWSQKDFALSIQSYKNCRSILFNIRKGDEPREAVIASIKKNYHKVDRLEGLFADLSLPIYEGDFFSEE